MSQPRNLAFWIPISIRKYSAAIRKNWQQFRVSCLNKCTLLEQDGFSLLIHFGEVLFKVLGHDSETECKFWKKKKLSSNTLKDIDTDIEQIPVFVYLIP